MKRGPVRLAHGSAGHRAYQAVFWALFIGLVLLVPFLLAQPLQPSLLGNDYTVSLSNMNLAVAWTVAVLGLAILTGHNGQVSLGNSFFVGVGAYVTVIFVSEFNWSYVSTLVLVLPFCLLVGLLIGLPALRIRGLYLAVLTFALAAVFPSLVKLDEVSEWTGGSNGKDAGSDLVPPDWLPLEEIARFLQDLPLIGGWFGADELGGRQLASVYRFLLLAIVAGVCFLLARNLLRSRPGRAIVAIRDNEIGASVSGVNTSLYKAATFGVSAMLGGVAGMMFTMDRGFVSPDDFSANLGIFLIVGVIVGGASTIAGAVLGGLAIVFVPHWASETAEIPGVGYELSGPWGPLLLGALMILLMFVMPGGIVHGFRRIRDRFVRVTPVPPEEAAAPRSDEQQTVTSTSAPQPR